MINFEQVEEYLEDAGWTQSGEIKSILRVWHKRFEDVGWVRVRIPVNYKLGDYNYAMEKELDRITEVEGDEVYYYLGLGYGQCPNCYARQLAPDEVVWTRDEIITTRVCCECRCEWEERYSLPSIVEEKRWKR